VHSRSLPRSRSFAERKTTIVAVIALISLNTILCHAGDHKEEHVGPFFDRFRHCEDRSLEGRHARAGCPRLVLPWAGPAYECFDCGYYVGGGSPCRGQASWFKGEPRYPHEGTWGVDYAPWTSRVRLQWFHGYRAQGFGGQYEPNGHNNPVRDVYRP
jgi:hypothetical protein